MMVGDLSLYLILLRLLEGGNLLPSFNLFLGDSLMCVVRSR